MYASFSSSPSKRIKDELYFKINYNDFAWYKHHVDHHSLDLHMDNKFIHLQIHKFTIIVVL